MTDRIAYRSQAVVVPTAVDNFSSYPFLQLSAALPLLRAVLAGNAPPPPSPRGPSRLWPHPTLAEYLRARRQRGVR